MARKRPRADWDNAKALYPSVKGDAQMWVDFFDQQPEVFAGLLGDIYRTVRRKEDHERSGAVDRGGKRALTGGSMEELHAMLTPRYATVPFTQAFHEVQGERSIRQIASRIPIDHTQLVRMVRGSKPVSMDVLEGVARVCKVGPAYFLEWRIYFVQQTFTEAFMQAPQLSIGAFQVLTGRRRQRVTP